LTFLSNNAQEHILKCLIGLFLRGGMFCLRHYFKIHSSLPGYPECTGGSLLSSKAVAAWSWLLSEVLYFI